MHSKETLINDLHKAGIKKGDTLFVRISYKAVGKVEGGPKTLIDAILDTIGEEGNLLATAFPKRIESHLRFFHRNEIYKKGQKPSTGAIPAVMSTYPEAKFSSNPISPYVIIGKNAEEIASLHTPESESYDVVKYIIENFNPKCLRIGGDILDGTAHLAFSEGLRNTHNFQRRIGEGMYYLDEYGKKRWKERSVSAFCYHGFGVFFNNYIKNTPAVLYEGKIGDGDSMITRMKDTYLIEHKYIAEDPQILKCNSPTCVMCNVSYSYSSLRQFLLNVTKHLFSKDWKNSIYLYCLILKIYILGKKCT